MVVMLAGLVCLFSGAPRLAKNEQAIEVPGFADRPYILHTPIGLDTKKPTPVILVLHGGGGDALGMLTITCPDKNRSDPACIQNAADAEGFVTVFPSGTKIMHMNRHRAFNAGGGADGFDCIGASACEQGVDDIAYFKALLDDLAKKINVDTRRVFSTGLSNGGAMSHRLACELADRIAAIAPVGGANQFATAAVCAPSKQVPVLDIHGTGDPCWPFAGGPFDCLGNQKQNLVGVPATIVGSAAKPGWSTLYGCDPTPVIQTLPNSVADGTETFHEVYSHCKADVEVLRIEGGGHTWPGGDQYMKAKRIGPVSRDFNASTVIVDFFKRHPGR